MRLPIDTDTDASSWTRNYAVVEYFLSFLPHAVRSVQRNSQDVMMQQPLVSGQLNDKKREHTSASGLGKEYCNVMLSKL